MVEKRFQQGGKRFQGEPGFDWVSRQVSYAEPGNPADASCRNPGKDRIGRLQPTGLGAGVTGVLKILPLECSFCGEGTWPWVHFLKISPKLFYSRSMLAL